VSARAEPTGLRAARVARGWSQTEAARALVALGRAAGAPVAAAASLKTLLSRWENGHALPEPQYRTLLGELYDRSPAELGIAGPPEDPATATAPARLRASLAAAATLDRAGVDLWWQQLAVATRLDDELGAAGAGEVVRAQVEQLDETLTHTPTPAGRAAVAAVLAWTAALAGAQELDRGRPDRAWRRYDRARAAAQEAGLPAAVAVAVAGQAAVLVDVGEAAAAVALVEASGPLAPAVAQARLDAARGVARAAAGDAAAARAALAASRTGAAGAGAAEAGTIDAVGPPGRPVVELADVHRWHGRALVTLGDAAAVHPLERALAAPPRSARHRAAVHADLALALAADHPEAAAEHARAARLLAERIGSERVIARLSGLATRS
jgi:transcriptional regulator with XRE-family HTH domain